MIYRLSKPHPSHPISTFVIFITIRKRAWVMLVLTDERLAKAHEAFDRLFENDE